jgi:hypothetical protein
MVQTDDELVDSMSCLQIYEFPRVTPTMLVPKKISIDTDTIPETKRHKVMYDYGLKELKELHLTFPFKEEAYVILNTFQEEKYKNVATGKLVSSFLLRGDNNYHVEMWNAMQVIVQKLTKIFGSEIKFPFTSSDVGVRIYVKLIQDKAGKIYTPFYTKTEQVDITKFGAAVARLALTMSIGEKGRVTLQVYQGYVHEQVKNFPLALHE